MKFSTQFIENGSDMIELFIKHPVHYFPVLKKNKIVGYIVKKKVLRFSTDQNFLDRKVSDIFPLLIENLDHDFFFDEIENQKIKLIPYLLWVSKRLEIHKKNKLDFFRMYKPVGSISPDDIIGMIDGHDFPMIVFDGSGGLLMENRAAKKVRSLFKSKQSPNPYLHWIKKNDIKFSGKLEDKPSKRITGTKTYMGYKSVYHFQHFYFRQASVNLVIFLSFQKKS